MGWAGEWMRAMVHWRSADGTTQPMMIEGPYISSQLWDGGRATVTVYDRQGDQRLRCVQFSNAVMIDIETVTRGASKNDL